MLFGGRRIRPIFVFGDAFVGSRQERGLQLLAGRRGSTYYLRIIDWKGGWHVEDGEGDDAEGRKRPLAR